MASLAVHDKASGDEVFIEYLGMAEAESDDPRKYVMKAVNWAVRQVGKRNARLHREAVAAAERIAARGSAPSRWIASDALRELRGAKVLERLSPDG